MRIFISTLLLLNISYTLQAQTSCTTPGQNPSTAFPVCGTGIFSQTSVPICGGNRVPNPACNNYPLTDVNPFWYKFTCYQAGTLGFIIKPTTVSEDYDWQLFDITNRNPADVYTDVSLSIASNWSGEGGETGASAAGSQLFVCEGRGKPLWSKMPVLIQGHEYILLVSHFTQTQSGYSISFGGGTAVITDSTQPKFTMAEANCGGDVLKIKLNKKIKCTSLTSNGSEFYVTPGNNQITVARGLGCQSGFDTDSIELSMGSFLTPGKYTLHVRQGSDANTLLDYCDNSISISDQVEFEVYPLIPTPMDSMSAIPCTPQSIKLIFRKPLLCTSLAGNGSDFTINGSYPVSISGAKGNCSGTTTKEITIQFAKPLFLNGTFSLVLKSGSDGNTLIDECGQTIPAGSSLSFTTEDTVNANFTYKKLYGCTTDTVQFSHNANNGVNNWKWSLDDNQTSTDQNPTVYYQLFNQKNVQLIVSNGICSDSSNQVVSLDNFLKADFTVFGDVCPNEPTAFTSLGKGLIKQHNWTFGDGGTSFLPSPSHTYTGQQIATTYVVMYSITDSIGCIQTAQKSVRLFSSCYLAVPSGFTPNRDGQNDTFQPLNAVKAEKLDFRVYNRWGQLLYQTQNWKQGWDGTFRGNPQGSGVYVWLLSYVDRDSKEARQMKGTVMLVR